MKSERDHFASQALKALLTGRVSLSKEDAEHVAVMAYRAADAMLAVNGRRPRFVCTACLDGRKAYRQKLGDGVFGDKIPCPHCGLDPNEAETDGDAP